MTPWTRAITALRLTQLDPDGLGGVVIQARSGPVRDALCRLLQPHRRLHPKMTAETLCGGIDVAASLTDGTLVAHKGVLEAYGEVFVLPMAERTAPDMASHLAMMLDQRRGNALIALDEHIEDEPPLHTSVADRLAFHISLDGLALSDVTQADIEVPLAPLTVTATLANMETLVSLAVRLGITSLRAPSLALSAAKAHAALNHRSELNDTDLAVAAELVLAPRATQLPVPEEAPPPPEETDTDSSAAQHDQLDIPQEMILAAVETALPQDLLRQAASGPGRRPRGSGSGRKRVGNRRGRPLPSRDGAKPGGSARVDLIATLRAAVPWQTLRKQTRTFRTGPILRPSDLRYKRYEELSDRLLIFAVDASGSAALARLAEAKGAIEHLLAEAYASRDHVALIAFRGDTADLLLPPTRSLIQAKRRLADLPGGGGTPLAAGLNLSRETSEVALSKGMTPILILLTDGRSNVALDGTPDRVQAAADATTCAQMVAQRQITSIVIDTGRRPESALKKLAGSLQGQYISLPRADAKSVSETVTAALGS